MSERFVDQYLGQLLARAHHALYKDFDEHVRAAGLSAVEWRVLVNLHEGEALTVGQLARELPAKQPTVTKLAQRMAEQGWVELLADPDDQRCTRVAVTAVGRHLLKPLLEEARQHEARMLRTLGAQHARQLRRLLERLAAL